MVQQNTPEIRTERLLLRRFTAADLEAFFAIMRDEAANEFLPWFPVKTTAEAEAMLRKNYLDTYAAPCGFQYAVCLKGENVPIGYCGMRAEESHDFGYGLLPHFWHRGIMTEAAAAVLEQIRRAGVFYVTATHDVENPRSGAVMEKLGMRYQYSYGEQWQPKNRFVVFRLYQLNFDGRDWVYRRYWEERTPHFVEEIPQNSEKIKKATAG